MSNFVNNDNIIQGTIGNLYDFSNFHIGNLTFAQILDYLPGFGPDPIWGKIKFIALVLSFVMIILFILIIKKINKLTGYKINLAKEFLPPESALSGSNARWEEIQKHINSTKEAEWKFALIEADKLVDDTLKGAGFAGETMGDRLMNMEKGQLTTLDGLWNAHKTRNRLVHDSNYFLRYAEAKRAVMLYEKTLKELQAI